MKQKMCVSYYYWLNPQCGATYDAEGNVELFLKTMDLNGPTCLFGLVRKPKFLSAVSRRKLTSGAI